MAKNKIDHAWNAIKEYLVESSNGIIPLYELSNIMKIKESHIKSAFERHDPSSIDITGFTGNDVAIIGYRMRQAKQKSPYVIQVSRKWEDRSNSGYVQEFKERNELFMEALRNVIIPSGINCIIPKTPLKEALLKYGNEHKEYSNVIQVICCNDQKFIFAMNQFDTTHLNVTDTGEFEMTGYVFKNPISVSGAIGFTNKNGGLPTVKTKSTIRPDRYTRMSEFTALTSVTTDLVSKMEKEDLVKVIHVDDDPSPVVTEPKLQPVVKEPEPDVKEEPKSVPVEVVVEPEVKPFSVTYHRKPLKDLLKEKYGSKNQYYVGIYTAEFISWLKPYMIDTGGNEKTTAQQVFRLLKLFVDETGRKTMANRGNSLFKYIKELQDLYTICTDLPVETLYFDTDKVFGITGYRISDELTNKLPGYYPPPNPKPVVKKLVVVKEEPAAVVKPAVIKEEVKNMGALDVNMLKRALAIESSKMQDGMIDGEQFLSESAKKSLVELLDKFKIRDMILYTKLSEDRKTGQIAIRLVKDEYFGDFELVSPTAVSVRRINIASFITKRPSLTIVVPFDETPATLVYKEDLEPWGYSNADNFVHAVVKVVEHFMSK